VALTTIPDAGVKSNKGKSRFFVVEALGIELDEFRVGSSMLCVTGETEFILVLVVSLAVANATCHFGVAGQAPFVVDLTVEGVTGCTPVGTGKLGVKSSERTRGLSRTEILRHSRREEHRTQYSRRKAFQHAWVSTRTNEDVTCPAISHAEVRVNCRNPINGSGQEISLRYWRAVLGFCIYTRNG
jgi:hypothetical protein